MDKCDKTIGNIVSDTLIFMDDMGLSMAASDNPRACMLSNYCSIIQLLPTVFK